jgi:adenine-specific DNA-methyltransferase
MTARGGAAVTTTDLPERFNLASELPRDDRLAAIRAAFPEAVREDQIDFDVLRRSLGDWVEPGPERFGLSWPGKAECMRVIQESSIGTLVPMPKDSVDWDTTENVIVEGDNLEVLKLLQKAYYGKVKMIYIDPPYNTGKEFIYPDNFREGLADYLRYSGQTDEEGMKLNANVETDGRYHSKWLSMMYPRLFLARNLLADDGVIFITIDDNEVHNLRAVMNEVFGEENFVATIAWKHTNQSKNDELYFSRHYNSIVVYRRSEKLPPLRFERTETDNRAYSNPDNDPKGPWRSGDVRSPNLRETLRYDIESPSGKRIPPPELGWRWSRETLEGKIATGEIVFSRDETRIIRKIYLSEQEGRTPENVWLGEFAGTSRSANAELKELFDVPPFDTPKPTQLVQRMLELATPGGEGLVLDFFAGSGSTGDAVMRLNATDRGNRKYLLVQLPEPVEQQEYGTVAAITRERIRRAGARLSTAPSLGSSVDVGFRAYALRRSNFLVWDSSATAEELEQQLELSIKHVADGATEDSVLTELLLKSGYPLTSPVMAVEFAGIKGHSVADGALLVCLSRTLSIEVFEAMVELDPVMIVVLDAGFGDSDELKVNALQTVRARNQQSGSDITLRVV